mgnify:FL=1
MQRFVIVFILLLGFAGSASAQTMASIKAEAAEKAKVTPWDKKFRWGGNYNMYWSTIVGDNLAKEYFTKPSIGFDFRVEYYFTKVIGVGLGIGYQQRGAGIINLDKSGGAFAHPWVVGNNGVQGDVDSTYLEKVRFNTIEVPLTLLLRSPKDLIKGMRPSGSIGAVYMYNIESNDVFQAVVDGTHKDTPVTADYFRHDVGLQFSAGFDIDVGGTGTVFQAHFVYSTGVKNVYAAGQGDGRQIAYGVRLAFLF